jgi:hypothetical protein
MRQMPTTPGDRTEYGHDFRWYERPGCWHTTAGKAVVVVPPTKPHESWLIIIPDDDTVEEFEGHEAEKRAFCLADGYRRQH